MWRSSWPSPSFRDPRAIVNYLILLLVAIIAISAPGMYEVYARVHLDQTFMTVALGVVYAE